MEKHFCTGVEEGLRSDMTNQPLPLTKKLAEFRKNSAIFLKRANYNGKEQRGPVSLKGIVFLQHFSRIYVLIAGKISSWNCCLMDCEKLARIQYLKNFFFSSLIHDLGWVDKKLIQITFAPAVISMKLESNKSVVLLLSKLNELWKDVDHPWKKY